jgi:hypothetical protein
MRIFRPQFYILVAFHQYLAHASGPSDQQAGHYINVLIEETAMGCLDASQLRRIQNSWEL